MEALLGIIIGIGIGYYIGLFTTRKQIKNRKYINYAKPDNQNIHAKTFGMLKKEQK
jgi:uncharacterized protein YneF (UPF0154 family)